MLTSQVLFLTALIITRAPPSVPELETQLLGRWDSVAVTLEGDSKETTEWAESLEFNGKKVTSSVYKIKDTPNHSLFKDLKSTPSAFSIEARNKGDHNDRMKLIRANGKVTRALFNVEPDTLLITLRTDGQEPKNFGDGLRILAVKSTEPDAPNLQVIDFKKMHGWWRPSDELRDGGFQATFLYSGIKQTVFNRTTRGVEWTGRPIVLRPDKNPKEYDLLDNGVVSQKGIYEVTEDSIRFCLGEKGMDRPTTFETNDSGVVLRLVRTTGFQW